MQAAILGFDKHNPPVSLVEQGVMDRDIFLARQAMVNSLAVSHEQQTPVTGYVTSQNAEKLIADIVPQLSSQYRWLQDANIYQITCLLNEVIQYRSIFRDTYDKLPSDSRIYRNYRLALEQDDSNDQELYDKVILLEALMNGDVTKGSLPLFDSNANQ